MDIASERAYATPFVNATLLPMLLLSLTRQKHTPNTAKSINGEYDYIVVGAGSAGSVVASRLSELPCVSVLLLEAGKPPPLLTEVPGIGRFFWNSDIDWQYRTTPQKYTGAGLINRQVVWPSGKTLGGSSVLNAMMAVRGNRKNFDDWEAAGAKGWSYKDVLPYFKKMEDNRDPEYVANGFHGVHGPQTVHRPRYKAEFKGPLFKTIKSMGYKVVDPNGARQTGFYDLQGTTRAGQRCSTAKAYLVPAENRTNLDILPNAMVRKVLIKKRRAVGVQFDHQGSTYVVKAKREVIMSAGAVNSAQLLMLSGIGPRKELERHKIPMVANLPVGQNLQEHVGTILSFTFRPDIPRLTEKLINPANIAEYIQNRTGPLASTEFIAAVAFLKGQHIVPKKDFPDHQLYFSELISEVTTQVGFTPEVIAQAFAPYIGRSFYVCVSHLLQPKSIGTVTLQSKDPYDPPLIDPNYLEDPKDVQAIVNGLKTCMRIGTSPFMRKVGSTPFETLIPGCEKFAGDEDSYYACLARTIPITFNHQVGTARMGHPKDPRTVVDPHLRVLNIKGLRVVDASVMPIVPSGNTNLPTIMVGEKASDIIKSTIECHKQSENEHHWDENEDYPWKEESWKETEDSEWSQEPHPYPTHAVSDHHDCHVKPEHEDWKDESPDNIWPEIPPKVSIKHKVIQHVVPWNKELTQISLIPGTQSQPEMPLGALLPLLNSLVKGQSGGQTQSGGPLNPATAPLNPTPAQVPLNPAQAQVPLNPSQPQIPQSLPQPNTGAPAEIANNQQTPLGSLQNAVQQVVQQIVSLLSPGAPAIPINMNPAINLGQQA